MQIKQVEFIQSSTSLENLPKQSLPEFAFVGRSNVGKSSLINMLAGQKNLAHTSQNPGKTQTINHFRINQRWFLVDLPGYGYARRSKKQRSQMMQFLRDYLLKAPDLMNLFVLLDARIEPQKSDLEFMQWLGLNEIPFTMVFTKIDKLSSHKLSKSLRHYREEMLKTWEFLPKVISTSAVSKSGKDEILAYIDEILKGI